MSDRNLDESSYRRLMPVDNELAAVPGPVDPAARPLSVLITAWVSLLRQRWLLATGVALLVLAPLVGYTFTAVPTYTSSGVLQVSSQQSGLDPMLELMGGGASSELETEVEIIRRRAFVLAVFQQLRLHVIDADEPTWISRDRDVSAGLRPPTSSTLRRVRDALDLVEVDKHQFKPIAVSLVGVDDHTLAVRFGDDKDDPVTEINPGDTLVHPRISLRFATQPLAVGEGINLKLLPDGDVLNRLMPKLVVAAIGDRTKPTNLVSIAFSHPDRDVAQAVVNGIMSQYLAQSLHWQVEGASKAAEFIKQRLAQAESELREVEEKLREFAERERAVQLETQARVTIENAAELEAQRRQTELQQSVLDGVIAGLRKTTRQGQSAHLTANFFDDPVLAASIATLTEAETRHAGLAASLTPDHPQVRESARRLELQRQTIDKLLRSSRQNLATRKHELESQLSTANDALASYPGKDVQMARLFRDVEVSQKLYAFLLERHREAEIVEASTTINKRVVDAASIPHMMTTPKRGRLLATSLVSALFAAFAAVWLAHTVQRKLPTLEAVKRETTFAVYGTVPLIAEAKEGHSHHNLETVWKDSHGPVAEAFRALCVSVSMCPARGRGRLIQITSSQPGEGKSTVSANLAISLRRSGARVLLVDLDLRKPVQHRHWKTIRTPGYADIIAAADNLDSRHVVQSLAQWEIDFVPAGSKLPDTMSALMTPRLNAQLEAWAERYDFVLVDTPPAFVPDTTIVARHVDLVLVVARPGVVERASLRQAIASLGRVRAPKGLVLKGVTRRHSEYYYGGGGYGYAYAYGASYGEAPEAADEGTAAAAATGKPGGKRDDRADESKRAAS